MSTTTCGKTAGAILFVSLAINVFALGYIFGDGGLHHRPMFQGFGHQMGQLSEPTRSNVKAVMDQYRPKLKAEMQTIRADHEAVEAALKSPDYSRNHVEALFSKLRTETDKAQALAQAMMLEVADKLSPEEREKFFNHPHEHGPKGPGPDDTAPPAVGGPPSP